MSLRVVIMKFNHFWGDSEKDSIESTEDGI